MTTFASLELIEPLQRALADASYEKPTPIQAQAIPPLLKGRDVLGCAQTGTGKTAAFALPVLQHLAETPRSKGKRRIRALVLTPTRELAAQIGESFSRYGRRLPIEQLVMFGGVNENPQIRALRKGLDVLIATPGRLLDLQSRGFVNLGGVNFFVLDEADRMLDMGFVHDVRKVIKSLPKKRQNLLFSATMPPTIVNLAASFLRDPIKVEVTPQATTVEKIDQTVMFCESADKRRLLARILNDADVERAIVFTRTKHGANRLVQQLGKSGVEAAAIHGNKSQGARNRALAGFRSGDIPILVATDIAARGIDVDGVSHVFNYDLPNEPEVYVHRIGRTGRAGRSGIAIAFCGPGEGGYLRSIERLIGMKVPRDTEHDLHFPGAMPGAGNDAPPKREQRPPRPPRPGGSGRGRRASGRRGAGAGGKPGASGKPGAGRSGSSPSTPGGGGKPAGSKPGGRSGAGKSGGAKRGDGGGPAKPGRNRRRRSPRR